MNEYDNSKVLLDRVRYYLQLQLDGQALHGSEPGKTERIAALAALLNAAIASRRQQWAEEHDAWNREQRAKRDARDA